MFMISGSRHVGIAGALLGAWLFGEVFLAAGWMGARLRADDWPQWRGPHRDGSAPGAALPSTLPSALREVWRVPVGEGYSGPVIAGGKVVVFCRRSEKETALCLDARSGKEIWKDAYDAPFKPEDYSKAHGKGPFSTPAIADGKVYLQGITAILSSYDLSSGALVWRKDFAGQFKKPYPMWGAAASPLIEGKFCIVWIGTEENGALAAFDKDTGQVAWKNTDLEPSYSSPVAADLAGARQVVALTRTHLIGVDPGKGEVLWKIDYKVKYEQNIVTPVVRNDIVFIAGYEEPTMGVRVARSGSAFAAEKAWSNDAVAFFMCSPIPQGDCLYGVTQGKKGALACIGMADGKVKWMTEGGLGEYASIVAAGEKLLIATAKGDLLLVAADPAGYKELSRISGEDRRVLPERGGGTGLWSHLALTKDALYIKDRTYVARYELFLK